jgi:hypothetical protein
MQQLYGSASAGLVEESEWGDDAKAPSMVADAAAGAGVGGMSTDYQQQPSAASTPARSANEGAYLSGENSAVGSLSGQSPNRLLFSTFQPDAILSPGLLQVSKDGVVSIPASLTAELEVTPADTNTAEIIGAGGDNNPADTLLPTLAPRLSISVQVRLARPPVLAPVTMAASSPAASWDATPLATIVPQSIVWLPNCSHSKGAVESGGLCGVAPPPGSKVVEFQGDLPVPASLSIQMGGASAGAFFISLQLESDDSSFTGAVHTIKVSLV